MEEHFVNYNQALALKELGFDEPCIARYIIPGDLVFKGCYEDSNIIHLELTQNDICEAHVLAPLKSQVFKWFREKHGLFVAPCVISYENDPYLWFFEINSTILPIGTYLEGTDDYKTYEEAESACIDKLISILKQKKS